MIKNLWSRITFCCINGHEHPIPFRVQAGKTNFYACEKYFQENRTPEERACANRLNLDDAQGIVLKLSDLIEENDNIECRTDLTNYSFTYVGPRASILVKIVKYSEKEIILGILNETALRV